jgi:hypothetical protein
LISVGGIPTRVARRFLDDVLIGFDSSVEFSKIICPSFIDERKRCRFKTTKSLQ